MNAIQKDILFCSDLIGKPWVAGQSGPDSFDCWGLLRFLFLQLRGVNLSEYSEAWAKGLLATIRTAEAEAADWEEVPEPFHFCVVGMGRARRIEHVGLWLGDPGGILHAIENAGVVFQTPGSIRSTGIQHFKYYNFRP